MVKHKIVPFIKILNYLGVTLCVIAFILIYVFDESMYSMLLTGIGSACMIPDGVEFYNERTTQNPRTKLFWGVEIAGLLVASLCCNICILIRFISFIISLIP